jgi:hypothetical protein
VKHQWHNNGMSGSEWRRGNGEMAAAKINEMASMASENINGNNENENNRAAMAAYQQWQ